MTEQDRRISDAVAREQPRLRGFIRRWVADEGDIEDILQDVFYELVEAFRLAQPIEQIGAWTFRVARNRITDLFRKRWPAPLRSGTVDVQDGEPLQLEDLLHSPAAGPETAYARGVLLEELEAALDELPPEQREVFLAHEVLSAEARKLELEGNALQAGQDLKTLLNQAVVSGKNVVEYRQQLTDASGKLNSVLAQLQVAWQNETLNSREGLIARYLIIYVFFFVIGLFFRTINALWFPFINILQNAVFSPPKHGQVGPQRERVRQSLRTFSQILYPLPNIAEIAVDVLVIAVVLVPLFDLTATSLGQNIRFSNVYHELSGAHIGKAVNLIKQIVAGG